MSRPPGKVKIEVFAESGAHRWPTRSRTSPGAPRATPLIVTWNPSSDAPVGEDRGARLRRAGQLGRRRAVPLVRRHPARRRQLPTGSADIDAAEVPKLEAAFCKVQEVLAKDKAHGGSTPASRCTSPGTPTRSAARRATSSCHRTARARSPPGFASAASSCRSRSKASARRRWRSRPPTASTRSATAASTTSSPTARPTYSAAVPPVLEANPVVCSYSA